MYITIAEYHEKVYFGFWDLFLIKFSTWSFQIVPHMKLFFITPHTSHVHSTQIKVDLSLWCFFVTLLYSLTSYKTLWWASKKRKIKCSLFLEQIWKVTKTIFPFASHHSLQMLTKAQGMFQECIISSLRHRCHKIGCRTISLYISSALSPNGNLPQGSGPSTSHTPTSWRLWPNLLFLM